MNDYGLFYKALLSTIAVETLVLFLLARIVSKKAFAAVSNRSLVFAGVCCSFSTLPYLWFVWPYLIESYSAMVITGEFLVVFMEGLLYLFLLRIRARDAMIVSAVCNLASVIFGLVAR